MRLSLRPTSPTAPGTAACSTSPPARAGSPRPPTSPSGWEVPNDSGIYLAGNDSVLRNSMVAFSAGHGVTVSGSFSRIENNVIHDVAYSGVNGSGVRVSGSGGVVRSNTIYNAGRT